MSTNSFLDYSGLSLFYSKLKSLFVTAVDGVADVDISGNAATASTASTASKLGTSTVGSGTKPIYLSSGTATASSSTVGSSTAPVYLNAGTITECGTVAAATKATQDGNGNTISSTYLPLSGGTMTGQINTNSASWSLYSTNTESSIRMCGGGFSSDGSSYASALYLYGNTHSSYPGYFRLRAGDTTNSYKDLVGMPDGTLTWAGGDVERVSAKSLGGNGYVKFVSGLIVQWGSLSGVNSSSVTTATLPTAFSSSSSYSAIGIHRGTSAEPNIITSSSSTATTVGFLTNYSSNTLTVKWIAIGY